MKRAGAVVALLLAGAAPSPKHRVFDPHQLEDLSAIVPVLRARVAELEIEVVQPKGDPLSDEKREGYGIVLDRTHVAALSFVVEDAKRVRIKGPAEKPIEGRVVLDDVERRVAIIESNVPLDAAGLVPAERSPLSARKVDTTVFALTNTTPEATVIHGVITHLGEEPEYGGHHRVDLELTRGMPVFDDEARFVGYARAVAWDKDKRMLVTPEQIAEARTATGAADRERAHPTPPKKPWWSK